MPFRHSFGCILTRYGRFKRWLVKTPGRTMVQSSVESLIGRFLGRLVSIRLSENDIEGHLLKAIDRGHAIPSTKARDGDQSIDFEFFHNGNEGKSGRRKQIDRPRKEFQADWYAKRLHHSVGIFQGRTSFVRFFASPEIRVNFG